MWEAVLALAGGPGAALPSSPRAQDLGGKAGATGGRRGQDETLKGGLLSAERSTPRPSLGGRGTPEAPVRARSVVDTGPPASWPPASRVL